MIEKNAFPLRRGNIFLPDPEEAGKSDTSLKRKNM
jgi:hypothetical protein